MMIILTIFITAKIPVWLAEGYKELSDNRNIWDWIKYNIRINAIQHSKRKAKERNEKEKPLQNVYAKAKQNVDLDPNNANVNALNSAKENLELFYEEKVRGIVIRARARWHEYGERSSQGSQIRQIWRILRQNCSDDSTEVTEGVTSTPEIFGNKQGATLTPEILIQFCPDLFSQQIQISLIVNVVNLN